MFIGQTDYLTKYYGTDLEAKTVIVIYFAFMNNDLQHARKIIRVIQNPHIKIIE